MPVRTCVFFFQAEDGIRDKLVTGVQTCALPISEVYAQGDVFFNGGAVFDLATQKYLGEFSKQVVLTPDVVYAYKNGACRAYDAKYIEEPDDDDICGDKKATEKPKANAKRWQPTELASCK